MSTFVCGTICSFLSGSRGGANFYLLTCPIFVSYDFDIYTVRTWDSTPSLADQ